MPLGVNLALLIGKTVPTPVPRSVIEAFHEIEVTHTDEDLSGFKITFKAGRTGPKDLKDYGILSNPLFKPLNRVIIVVTIGTSVNVLMDGVILDIQLSPSLKPGESSFTIMGEDVSAMMDFNDESVTHMAQDEATIARLIILNYAQYGLIPKVIKPKLQDRPTINERTPAQVGTDLDYLRQMARRFAHVFFVTPGPTPGSNIAYWGPPKQQSVPQKALTVNMGSFSNVSAIDVEYDAMAATAVDGSVKDRKTGKKRPVSETKSDRPSLSKRSALGSQAKTRVKQFRQSGRSYAQADALAQAIADESVDKVAKVTGEIDTVRYGTVLKLRGYVGLRGVGHTYDGLYYVKEVKHTLTKGNYKQSFTITREGLGTTQTVVRV